MSRKLSCGKVIVNKQYQEAELYPLLGDFVDKEGLIAYIINTVHDLMISGFVGTYRAQNKVAGHSKQQHTCVY